MLRLALILFLLAIVAAIFGFGGIASSLAYFAELAFYAFIILFVITLIVGLVRR